VFPKTSKKFKIKALKLKSGSQNRFANRFTSQQQSLSQG